ncbi:MAG: hypothetical protein Q7T18_11360 [Sedimentisphaerales bacterium]|nr:hypothetical protein [Sedimentisphaerales bacterium]
MKSVGKVEKDNVVKAKRPTWQIVVLIVFFIIGFLISQPCLCREGAVKGAVKSMLLLIVLARFGIGLYKNNLTKADFVGWIGVFLVFCFGIEML